MGDDDTCCQRLPWTSTFCELPHGHVGWHHGKDVMNDTVRTWTDEDGEDSGLRAWWRRRNGRT